MSRLQSPTDIYHITVRAIDGHIIFHNDEDLKLYFSLLKRWKIKYDFIFYGYCLMNNHVHLLIKSDLIQMSKFMQSLTISFTKIYNKRYHRTGPIFDGRYKSECVDNIEYFLNTLRYIHLNPVKAKLATLQTLNTWNSYHEYINHSTLCNTCEVLKYFGKTFDEQKKYFDLFHQEYEKELHLQSLSKSFFKKQQLYVDDTNAILLIKSLTGFDTPKRIADMSIEKKKAYVAFLKHQNLSIRQISRLTGIARGYITQILKP